MRAKLFLAALLFALCLCPLSAAFAAAARKAPADAATAIDPQALAKVVPGITRAQVKSLLGAPWRTVQYNDLDEVGNECWEYRGEIQQGPYRVHIEFNKQGTVLRVGKISDKVAGRQGHSRRRAQRRTISRSLGYEC